MEPVYIPPHPNLDSLSKKDWSLRLWRQFHDRPEQTGGDLSREKEWIDGFAAAIPCWDCQQHFKGYVRHNPPDLRSVRHYFTWGFKFHNAVNHRIGKPKLPWQDVWGEQPTD